MTKYEQATLGYAAALLDIFGDIDCHPYIENDGRVYLRVSVDSTPWQTRWLRDLFSGRAELDGSWEATGRRAAELLELWSPYVILKDRGQIRKAIQEYRASLPVVQAIQPVGRSRSRSA